MKRDIFFLKKFIQIQHQALEAANNIHSNLSLELETELSNANSLFFSHSNFDVEKYLGVLATKKNFHKYHLNLYFCLIAATNTYELYKFYNIPEHIFADTMRDINVWVENCVRDYGIYGLKEIGWIANHLKCDLFKLGRLQFQFFSFDKENYIDNNGTKLEEFGESVILSPRQPVLNVHIPQGEPLNHELCTKSYDMASEFFHKYFSYDVHHYVCDSWLLDPELLKILDVNSNIIKFQSDYIIFEQNIEDGQAIERIFNMPMSEFDNFPRNTSLQKVAYNHILSGGKLGVGYGVMVKK